MTIAPDGLSLYVVNYELGTTSRKLDAPTCTSCRSSAPARHPIGITYDARPRPCLGRVLLGRDHGVRRRVTRSPGRTAPRHASGRVRGDTGLIRLRDGLRHAVEERPATTAERRRARTRISSRRRQSTFQNRGRSQVVGRRYPSSQTFTSPQNARSSLIPPARSSTRMRMPPWTTCTTRLRWRPTARTRAPGRGWPGSRGGAAARHDPPVAHVDDPVRLGRRRHLEHERPLAHEPPGERRQPADEATEVVVEGSGHESVRPASASVWASSWGSTDAASARGGSRGRCTSRPSTG